uniref:Glutathione peroxidase n=1 Tax=Xenopsylla cheopis TaxID=163159 RepID=A0A6M2E2V6_XENCH
MARIVSLGFIGTAFVALRLCSPNIATMATLTNPTDYANAKSIYEFSAKDIKGNVVSLSKYKGHVCIIVNVASQCGLTANNYKELGELQEKYGESKGLKILAFPCNQFLNQEPGSPEEIVCFAAERNAKFDFFDKIDVNGDNAHPLWSYLKLKQPGTLVNTIKWNFTKFIVDKNGQPVERFSPNVSPLEMEETLKKYF